MLALIMVFLFTLGLGLGSFLNAWIWRHRAERSIARGRSLCPSCEKTLRWFDLIPVISFFGLRGRCRFCNKKIPWRYPLIELWMGVSFAAIGWLSYQHTGGILPLVLLRFYLIIFVLTFLFAYDVLYQELPDEITLPAIIMFGIAAIVFHWHSLTNLLIGLFVGGGVFLVQYAVSRGRWIGGGDIRLGILMGVILGWPVILVAMFIAYITGAIYGVALLILKKASLQTQVPFGAFLTTATLVSMVWGSAIVRWYLGLLSLS